MLFLLSYYYRLNRILHYKSFSHVFRLGIEFFKRENLIFFPAPSQHLWKTVVKTRTYLHWGTYLHWDLRTLGPWRNWEKWRMKPRFYRSIPEGCLIPGYCQRVVRICKNLLNYPKPVVCRRILRNKSHAR